MVKQISTDAVNKEFPPHTKITIQSGDVISVSISDEN